MSLSKQNLSIIIVSFFSDSVIHNCIKSIPKDLKIIVIDNSNNINFKQKIEEKYKNVKCILSSKNIGMGRANNLGLKNIETDYAFILNPDVILEKDTIKEMIKESKNLETFGIIAPTYINENYPNYKYDKHITIPKKKDKPFKVNSVDGFAMILNVKKLKHLDDFQNHNFFDENFFMYLENDDLCKRVIKNNENIFIVPKSKVNHIGASAVDNKYEYEIELSRNWHWIWSKYYYNKKHHGSFFAFFNGLPTFLSAILKYLFYYKINKKKRDIYLHRALGFFSACIGKKSFLRPKIK
jgi:GT2 family glycosyltransferase